MAEVVEEQLRAVSEPLIARCSRRGSSSRCTMRTSSASTTSLRRRPSSVCWWSGVIPHDNESRSLRRRPSSVCWWSSSRAVSSLIP